MVQYGDESIKLSGITSIAPTVLDFTGTTTAETSVTITDLTGYLNGGRISGLKILPPELKQSGSTGTTTVNVENYVLKAVDPYGSVGWSPISGISWSVSACTSPLNVTNIVPCTLGGTIYFNAGNLEINNTVRINDGSQVNGYVFTSDGSGNGSWQILPGTSPISCINDFYVSNIHACSPLNINPLDEGNVYFGSTSGVTIDVTNSRLGIGTETPQYPLDILGVNSRFYYDPTSLGGLTILSGGTNIPRHAIIIPSYLSKPAAGGSVGIRSWSDVAYPGYGQVGDMFMYAGNDVNGSNIINGPGTNTEDYIRFYAGDYAHTTTAHIHIQGSGTTRGFVGINTETPTERLDVNGKTKTSQLQVTTSPTSGYVLTSDISGNATWQPSGAFTGNTSASCITDLYVTNVHGCSPITFWDSLQTIGSSANGLSSIALGISNTADGISSSAFGGGTLALGSASFAEGYQTLALGDSSHSEGYQTIAGYRALTATSIVSGVVTISDNVDYSSEFTSGTVLLNNQFYTYTGTSYSAPNFFINLSDISVIIPLVSVNVVDYNNYNSPLAYISVGDNAHAEGLSTVALGAASHAEGMTTQAIGDISHAEGYQTLAYGVYSHAEGYGSVSYGQYSHAQNNFTAAFGADSHAEGQGTTAYGNFSHAQGSGTFAVGEGSHSEGYYTNAYGKYSHAGGSGSTVSGETSFIHSVGSLLTGNRSVLLGGLNLTGTTDDTVYVPYLNINNLGAGTSINNLGIDSNGNVVIGTSGSGSTSSATIDPYYNVGSASTVTWDVSGTSTNYEITLTASTTLNLTNVRNGDYGSIIVNQDGVGSKTITLGTVNGSATTHKVVNGGGGLPTLTATALAIDILSFTYNGSRMFWTVGNDYT